MSSCATSGTTRLMPILKNSKPSLPLSAFPFIDNLFMKMTLQLYDYEAVMSKFSFISDIMCLDHCDRSYYAIDMSLLMYQGMR